MNRMIDTATWDDPWFADLDPESKLLFLYFLTNRRSTAAGAFEITLRAMSFETGIEQPRIEYILANDLPTRVQWWPDLNIVWVRNFFRHQAANDNFRKSAIAYIAGLPLEVQEAIASVYPNLVPEGVAPRNLTGETGKGTHLEPMPTGTDTRPLVIDREEKSKRAEKKGADAPSRSAKPKPAVSGDTPAHRIVNAFYGVVGGTSPAPAKDLGIAKNLVNAGVTVDDLTSLVEWARNDWTGREGVDLGVLVRGVTRWRTSKPAKPDIDIPDDLFGQERIDYARRVLAERERRHA